MFLIFKNLSVDSPLGWFHFLAAVSSVVTVGVLVSLWRVDSVHLVHVSRNGIGGCMFCFWDFADP